MPYGTALMPERDGKSQEKLLTVNDHALIHDHCGLPVLAWLILLTDGKTRFPHQVLYGIVARSFPEVLLLQYWNIKK